MLVESGADAAYFVGLVLAQDADFIHGALELFGGLVESDILGGTGRCGPLLYLLPGDNLLL